MSFKPLKKFILATALTLSCAFNAEAQVPGANNFAARHILHHSFSMPKDTVIKTFNDKGGIFSIERYTKGELNDGPKGEPGYQEFNENGQLIALERYKNGVLNDAPDGKAAIQDFNDAGKLNHAEYYKNGKRNDSVNGDPAFQVYTDVDAKLILAMRYKDDVLVQILTAEEMAAYQKGGAGALKLLQEKSSGVKDVKKENPAHP
jgi:hypothetical protein